MFKNIVTFIGLFVILLSCTKENRESNYASQETKIEKYVSAQVEAQAQKDPESEWTVSYNDGAVRMTMVNGEGDELKADGAIAFYYALYDFSSGSISNSNLVATNYPSVASAAGWKVDEEAEAEPEIADLGKDDLLTGLKRGLTGVKKGEECMILFSGKYAYGNKAVGTISANAALAYHIWVVSIENK